MKEARTMRTLNHQNVTRLYGVACKTEPVMIVMELINGGSLDKYLREEKPSMEVKLQFAKGAAKGLEYLHSRGIIHRDIAARNCLYDANSKQVKIGDFGLSVHAKQHVSVNERLPIKWLAVSPISLRSSSKLCPFQPEVLSRATFTSKSDVYAFGVLLWEIFSNGTPPYQDKTTTDVQQYVVNGGKLTMPDGTPDFIKKIAAYCWIRNPLERWDMKRVVEKLDIYIRAPKILSTRKKSQADRSRAASSTNTCVH
jgi:serine/threonine protein kinase